MSRRRTAADRERLDEMQQRYAERTFEENYNLPKMVLHDQLSIDDDPDLGYYNVDVLDC